MFNPLAMMKPMMGGNIGGGGGAGPTQGWQNKFLNRPQQPQQPSMGSSMGSGGAGMQSGLGMTGGNKFPPDMITPAQQVMGGNRGPMMGGPMIGGQGGMNGGVGPTQDLIQRLMQQGAIAGGGFGGGVNGGNNPIMNGMQRPGGMNGMGLGGGQPFMSPMTGRMTGIGGGPSSFGGGNGGVDPEALNMFRTQVQPNLRYFSGD